MHVGRLQQLSRDTALKACTLERLLHYFEIQRTFKVSQCKAIKRPTSASRRIAGGAYQASPPAGTDTLYIKQTGLHCFAQRRDWLTVHVLAI
ncbi:MAG: hypothetical protein C0469_02150 [Cyanobacteria bacterium DS2.3.42]|nr:hypothetical protein [Cyanobacteria bacterium DS2.3.42]